MGTATFVLEDDGEAVACKVTYSEGFDMASKAHQAANFLVAAMDKACENLGPIPETPEHLIQHQDQLIVVEGDRARRG